MFTVNTDKLKLNEELAPKDILKYFETKYETEGIVTSRTIYNWLKELDIECIKPKPDRNKDIRYKKSDVLKLEENKKNKLLKIQHTSKQDKKLIEKAQLARNKYAEYNSNRSYNEDDSLSSTDSYEISAQEIVREDMILMCFEKLFPNIIFDTKTLSKNLAIRDLMNTMDFDDKELGEALNYIENKIYIKGKKVNRY